MGNTPNDNLSRLKDERRQLITKAKALTDTIVAENRSFRPEERNAFENYNRDIDGLTNQVDALERVIKNDEHSDDFRNKNAGGRTQPSILLSRRKYDELAAEQRALGTSSGSVLLPTEQAGEVFDRLRARSVFLAAGPRFVTVNTHAMRIPVVASSVTVGPRDAATTIAETDPGYTSRTLEPVSYAAYTEIANEVIADAQPSVLDSVANDLIRSAGTVIDTDIFNSTGAADPSYRMTGLFNVTGIQTFSAAGALTLDHVLQAITNLETAGANPDRIALFFTPASWTVLRKVKDLQNRYLIQPDPSQGEPPTLFGKAPYFSANLPTGKALAVDLDQVIVGQSQQVNLAYSDQYKFQQNETAVRLTTRLDVQVINPQAICAITGITGG